MISSFRRISFSYNQNLMSRSMCQTGQTTIYTKKLRDQIEYIDEILEDNACKYDWSEIKKNILSKRGIYNQSNINSVLLKKMLTSHKLSPAISFTNYLRNNEKDLNMGTVNCILRLYFALSQGDQHAEVDKEFIMSNYKLLTEKYKILDSNTCESLLHAICVIGEWKLGMKLLDDICYSSVPTHSAFNVLISTLFKFDKQKEAFSLIDRCISMDRSLQFKSYKGWIDYIFRKYKGTETRIKHLDAINMKIADNFITVEQEVAEYLKETYESLGWSAQNTKISRKKGKCWTCKEVLDNKPLTPEEFKNLQNNVKDKLIVGSDLFLKSSPEELKKFQEFVSKTAPYDVVLDSLNIVFTALCMSNNERISVLKNVIDYFVEQDKKVLLLGRQHMMKWPKNSLSKLLSMDNVHSFFAEDLSQDDPYILTSAILSGPHTDIVSRDIMRSHLFKLKDENLRQIFQRWQLQHQWMVISVKNKEPILRPPLTFSPYAQKTNNVWHIPFVNRTNETKIINDWVPDLHCWICLQPPNNTVGTK